MIDTVLNATHPADVFGDLPVDRQAGAEALEVAYRQAARQVHPDSCADPRAEEAFKRLGELKADAGVLLDAGRYGREAEAVTEQVRLWTRRHTYTLTDLLAEGDSCNVYLGEQEDTSPVLVKVARCAEDNDLVASEALMLRKLRADEQITQASGAYFPELIETFGYRAGDRALQANALRAVDGMVPLKHVMAFYPDGVRPQDIVWMMCRLLMALGFAHEQGIVHGAVLPGHVLIEPAQHGLMLIDWKYATEGGAPLEAISSAYRDWYPPEVLNKGRVLPGTDIFMAARLLERICGAREIPDPLAEFLAECQSPAPLRRPQDAWELKERFDEVLEGMWGPREFRPFDMLHVSTT